MNVEPPPGVVALKRPRILIVDDDRAIRQMYRTALALEGFDVDVADDGMAALRQIDDELPDLVVLDLHLPTLDGQEVLGELRGNARTRDIPVIVVTGFSCDLPLDTATALVGKPCDPGDLLAVVSQHISVPTEFRYP